MKIENQVCTIEQAKTLKELGISQDSYFHWQHYPKTTYREESLGIVNPLSKEGITDAGESWSAFSSAELGEMLIVDDDTHFTETRYNEHGGEWETITHKRTEDEQNEGFAMIDGSIGSTEAESKAEALLYLLEKRILTPEIVKENLAL